MVKGFESQISCVCGEDIDQHSIQYNELTAEYSSGGCFVKNCPCPQFVLKVFNERFLSIPQRDRLRFARERRIN